MEEGQELSNAGQHEEALVILDELIAVYGDGTDEDLALAYVIRGNVHDILGDFELALADYGKALELRPGYVPALTERGIAYWGQSEYDLAIADLDAAIELDPSYAFAYFRRGSVYRDMGDFDQALADYSSALELEPDASTAYLERGRVYADIGEFDLALADFDDAIGLDPTYPAIYEARGSVFLGLDEPELAFDDFSLAIDLDTNDAFSHFMRGFLLSRFLGPPTDKEILDAQIDLENALALTDDPDLITQVEDLLNELRSGYFTAFSMPFELDDIGSRYSDFVRIQTFSAGPDASPAMELSGVRRPGRIGGYGRYFFPELFLQPQRDQVPLAVFSLVWLYQDITSAAESVDIEFENSFDTELRWSTHLPQDPDWGLAGAKLANQVPVEFGLENVGDRGRGVYRTVEVFDLPESAVPPGPMFTVIAVFHRGPFLTIVGSVGQDLDLAQQETARLARIVDQRIRSAPAYGQLNAGAPQITRLSADERIAFLSDSDGAFGIYVMDTDGSNVIPVTDQTAGIAFPAWSPDGTRIAFQSDRDGKLDIYVIDADESNLVRLTNDPADDLLPVWAPDGSRIAFASARDGNGEIYVMDADGSNLTRLTNHPGADSNPAFFPDGTRIAFNSSRDGNVEIYVIDADGSNPTRLTNHPALDFSPVWSPDGSRIAFFSTRDGNGEIYVMDADGSNLTRLTSNIADDVFPAWSPDGRRIAFVSSRDGNLEIYVMDADGSNPTNLTSNPAVDSNPAWLPETTPAPPTAGTMKINRDTTLNADHLGNIVITANNITLDCAGHTVSGSDLVDNEFGIVAFGLRGVTITNCSVEGFGNGIKLENTHDSNVSQNTTTDNTEGISLSSSSGNIISDNRSDRNGFDGFLIQNSDGNLLIRNEATGNTVGFSLEGSNSNRLIDNVATGSSYLGLEDLEDGNVFEQNVFE